MKTKTLGDNTPSSIDMPHKYVYSWLCAYEHLITGWTQHDGQYMMILKTGEMVCGRDDEDGCGSYDPDIWDIYDYIDSEPKPMSKGRYSITSNFPDFYYLR